MKTTQDLLRAYLQARPLFLSVLRAKEAALYQSRLPLKHAVLDVGCGDGFFALTAFGKRKIDVGLDMETSRIGEVGGASAYKKTVTYDGRTLPFPNRSFRTVITNSVLEHVDDLPHVLSEIHRVLSSGGVCYATVMAEPWETYLFGAKVFGGVYRRYMRKKQVHKNLFSYGEWHRKFTEAGFRVRSVSPYCSPRAIAWLDVLHYVSFPSLVTYSINRRWVWWPAFTRYYPVSFFARLMDETISPDDAGALFFELIRP